MSVLKSTISYITSVHTCSVLINIIQSNNNYFNNKCWDQKQYKDKRERDNTTTEQRITQKHMFNHNKTPPHTNYKSQ